MPARRGPTVTLADRLLHALLSGVAGLLIGGLLMLVLGFLAEPPAIRPVVAYVVAAAFAGVGFVAGPAAVDFLGAWLHGLWAVMNAWANRLDHRPEPGAFRPPGLAWTALAIAAVAIWLGLR